MKAAAVNFILVLFSRHIFNIWSCSNTQFECGNGHCIDVSLKCDNSADCTDFTDEQNCTVVVPCPEGQYQCADASCIVGHRCNGMTECTDGSDEHGCGTITTDPSSIHNVNITTNDDTTDKDPCSLYKCIVPVIVVGVLIFIAIIVGIVIFLKNKKSENKS